MRNTGIGNSGFCNYGKYNAGDCNYGKYNAGDCNYGNYNSGNRNSGNYNSGFCNSGNYNSGAFNRNSPKMRLFEKELDMTVEEFYEKYDLYADLKLNEWVPSEVMTEDEKNENPSHNTTGGFLRTREYKDAWKLYWTKTNQEGRDKFLNLPVFDAEIFFDITGIDVMKHEPEELTIEEVCKLLGRDIKIKK